jgi:hypothetical protein
MLNEYLSLQIVCLLFFSLQEILLLLPYSALVSFLHEMLLFILQED